MCLLVLFAGCSGEQETGGDVEVEKNVIAFMPEQIVVKRWSDADIPSFEKRAAELGYDVVVHVAEGDAEKQIRQAETVLQNERLGAIVIVPADFDAARRIVEMANERNVPVIAYNDLVEGIEIAGFVGRNSFYLGEESARLMVEKYPKGNYFIVGGDAGSAVATSMVEGYHKVLDEIEDINIASEQMNTLWAADLALAQVESALVAVNDNVAAILCNNDDMANGALQALKARGLAGKVGLCGQDLTLSAAKQIVTGGMTFTAYTNFWKQGIDAAEMAAALIEGKPLPEHTFIDNGSGVQIPWIETELIFVDQRNILEFLKEYSWWLTIEEVFGDIPEEQIPEDLRDWRDWQ